MTVKETADYLGISVDTIYRMARAGELPHFKIRSLYRFEREFLDEWKRRQQMSILENVNKPIKDVI
ncbi:helix-turn-helix domain-containing protein [Metabacillus litoralis]|uniref:helix-turn-helix domain-containing protein n=1 Tax=Metabacillus litoralis TaxID=152268 RepID=UPI00203DB82A|nr:helix-turn-helix domain-containing protein [Metabacillus litoralis]MCM3651290.1 helix-turn-helix domain-containing protein [Metabacillus litoralis]